MDKQKRYFVIGNINYLSKEFSSFEEAKSKKFWNEVADEEVNYSYEEYKVVDEEELKIILAEKYNLNPKEDFLGDRTDRQLFIKRLEELNIQ
jgi:hypothetical protein